MSNLLRITPLSDINNWSAFHLFISSIASRFPMQRLGDYLRPIKDPIRVEDDVLYKQIKVRTKGQGAVLRKELYGKEIGTKNQFIAHKNNLIISKIDARNGAFGIIPDELEGAVITASFLQYEVVNAELEYIVLLLASDVLKDQWQALSSGTTNRQSVNEEKIESFMIPVPPVQEQRKILKKYHATLSAADANLVKGNAFSEGLISDLQTEVSDLKKQEAQKTSDTESIMQIIPFTSIRRWEVAYILREGRLENVYNSFKYPVYSISQLQKESLFGLSIKASTTQKKGMIPMIRMSNIVNGEIDCSGMKYLPYKCAVTDKEPDKWLLRKGDFLINRTNSKELVGKSAVFNLDGAFTYASYVIRYRFDTSIVLPEYINILFMLPIVRIQIDTVSRQTAGQCNINSDEIGAIRIPVPSIPEQQAIIDKYYSTRNGSKKYFDKARELRDQAVSDFENTIFTL